jgi:hypothetical protein
MKARIKRDCISDNGYVLKKDDIVSLGSYKKGRGWQGVQLHHRADVVSSQYLEIIED